MSLKYPHLLSPFKIGNHVFKNRMTSSPGKPHFAQGPEPYPADGVITHYANKAKSGAALITCSGVGMARPFDRDIEKVRDEHRSEFNPERTWFIWDNHGSSFDIYDGRCQNYLSQLAEAIHFYGSKCTMGISPVVPPGYDVSSGIPSAAVFGDGQLSNLGKEIPAELLEGIADNMALQAGQLKEDGFDGVFLHMAYRLRFFGRFLSPLTNRRKDKFGGSLENRARFALMVFDKIKQRCGKDFLIEASMSGFDPMPGEKLLAERDLPKEPGLTLQDAIQYGKMFTGHLDFLMLKAPQIDPAHPTGFNLDPTPWLFMAEAFKKAKVGVAIVTSGGYQDLDVCEEVIASGKADFIGMARSWITNPDYGVKAYEGRNEDVVPCLRCNACHVSSYHDPWVSTCAVNPTWGMEHQIGKMIDPPGVKKNVAVIGGGPAGMEAALIAAGRGHKVTLFEKSDKLGGLLKTTDYPSFKWPQRDFKNYLIRQINKASVKVNMNTEATPASLKNEGYDAVIAAVGSEPVAPRIPGIKQKNVFFAKDVYGNESKLAKQVVVIGGGEVGVETGMYLAQNGHKVMVLEMLNILARDAVPIHYYSMFREAWEKLPNFKFALHACCNRIEADSVTYLDAKGKEHTVAAGSVVIAAGMRPNQDLALKFFDAADRFYMIGDCYKVGNVQKAMRTAFSAASML